MSNDVVSENKLFDFNTFFTSRPGLYIWNDLRNRIGPKYPNPIPYTSIENLSAFTIIVDSIEQEGMRNSEVFEKLGGKDTVRKHAVTMDQIAQLITNQWSGKSGVMLNNGHTNIFYVVGKNDELFAVSVSWHSSDRNEWFVGTCQLVEDIMWTHGYQVFSNKA